MEVSTSFPEGRMPRGGQNLLMPENQKRMAPQVGLEPTTLRLTVARATLLLFTAVCCDCLNQAYFDATGPFGSPAIVMGFHLGSPKKSP